MPKLPPILQAVLSQQTADLRKKLPNLLLGDTTTVHLLPNEPQISNQLQISLRSRRFRTISLNDGIFLPVALPISATPVQLLLFELTLSCLVIPSASVCTPPASVLCSAPHRAAKSPAPQSLGIAPIGEKDNMAIHTSIKNPP